MPQPHASRDMSTLVGTSKTLERAISGLLMSSKRLAELLSEENKPASRGIGELIAVLNKLSKEERLMVDTILSHRGGTKHKPSKP